MQILQIYCFSAILGENKKEMNNLQILFHSYIHSSLLYVIAFVLFKNNKSVCKGSLVEQRTKN